MVGGVRGREEGRRTGAGERKGDGDREGVREGCAALCLRRRDVRACERGARAGKGGAGGGRASAGCGLTYVADLRVLLAPQLWLQKKAMETELTSFISSSKATKRL